MLPEEAMDLERDLRSNKRGLMAGLPRTSCIALSPGVKRGKQVFQLLIEDAVGTSLESSDLGIFVVSPPLLALLATL
jgi:hypothetical protein